MVLANNAYPNSSYYQSNHGNPRWTDEPNPEFYAQRIAENIHINVQIQGSQLMSVVRTQSMLGVERTGFRRIDPMSSSNLTDRGKILIPKNHYDTLIGINASYADVYKAYDEPTGDIRHVFPTIKEINPDLGTRWDPLFGPVTPDNVWVMQGTWAIGRAIDREIIDVGVFGSAVEGHGTSGNSFTTVAWNPSPYDFTANQNQNYIPAAGVGLTKNKIDQAAEYFSNIGVPANPQMRIFVITARQLSDFKDNEVITSADFVPGQPLQNNQIPQGFGGFTWRVIANQPGPSGESDIVPTTNGERRCFTYHTPAIGLGTWEMFESQVYVRPEIQNHKFLRVSATVGAVRIEDKLLLEVRCAE